MFIMVLIHPSNFYLLLKLDQTGKVGMLKTEHRLGFATDLLHSKMKKQDSEMFSQEGTAANLQSGKPGLSEDYI